MCRVILNVFNSSIIHEQSSAATLKTDRCTFTISRECLIARLSAKVYGILFHLTSGIHSSEMNYDGRTMRHVGESVLCD